MSELQTESPAEPKRGRQIKWYRSPLERDTLKALSQRSDVGGFAQTLTYLGLYATTAALSLYGFHRWPSALVIAIIFVHGTVCSFMINGIHELCHGTVFKTKAFNEFFVRVLSFLSWQNFIMFNTSHARHHAYTLHQPDDLEVTLPMKILVRYFFKDGFIQPLGPYYTLKHTTNVARGNIQGEWMRTLFPPGDAKKRRPVLRWARFLLIGHALILAVSLYFHLWLVPVVISLAPFYGGWLFFLCNNTQHIGLQDNVADFRLNCRTFVPNPLVRLLYWHMNFHIEHHMYPTVPCYRLHKLHKAIKADLPPCAPGIIPCWREIAAILARQKIDPTYQYVAPVPTHPGPLPAMI